MRLRMQRPTIVVAMTLIAGLALAACSTTPASSSAPSAQASVGGGGSVASTAPAASTGDVAVDLVFSGTVSVTAKGSAGQCTLGHSTADGSVVFGFGATESDYPGLEQGFYVNEDVGSHRLELKWLSSAVPSVSDRAEGEGFTYSSDHKSITLDVDLDSSDPEHVKGTISCP